MLAHILVPYEQERITPNRKVEVAGVVSSRTLLYTFAHGLLRYFTMHGTTSHQDVEIVINEIKLRFYGFLLYFNQASIINWL